MINARTHRQSLERIALISSALSIVGAVGACASSTSSQAVNLPDASARSKQAAAASGNPNAGTMPPTAPEAAAMMPSARGWQPGRKLDPFWISMTAESERAKWDDKFQPGVTPDPLALSAAPAANVPASRGEDTSEGLTHITMATQGADFDPCVSRDGQTMVFASTQHRPTADIYSKSINGRTITQLTSDAGNDVMPQISPDGQRIAFASNRSGNWDVYVMSINGGQAVQITNDPAQELHPSWSPDGSRLVFCRLGEVSGRWEMWVTSVSGTTTNEFVGFGLFPNWCPAAGTGAGGRDKILFQRSRERGDRAFSLWTVDYRPGDTSSPTEIVSSANAAAINASWSPEGSRIVYATIDNPNDLSAGSDGSNSRLPMSNLWMTSIDGTQRVALTAGGFMNLMPCWGGGSAGGRIYFVSDRTGVPNVWSVGTDKAIFAATGKAPEARSDVATTPEATQRPAAE